MDEDSIYEFAIGIVVVLGIFNYLYPGANFIATFTIIVVLAGILLLIKGLAQYSVSNEKNNIWAGAAFLMIIAILFGGLNTVLNGMGFALHFGLSALSSGLAWLATI